MDWDRSFPNLERLTLKHDLMIDLEQKLLLLIAATTLSVAAIETDYSVQTLRRGGEVHGHRFRVPHEKSRCIIVCVDLERPSKMTIFLEILGKTHVLKARVIRFDDEKAFGCSWLYLAGKLRSRPTAGSL